MGNWWLAFEAWCEGCLAGMVYPQVWAQSEPGPPSVSS